MSDFKVGMNKMKSHMQFTMYHQWRHVCSPMLWLAKLTRKALLSLQNCFNRLKLLQSGSIYLMTANYKQQHSVCFSSPPRSLQEQHLSRWGGIIGSSQTLEQHVSGLLSVIYEASRPQPLTLQHRCRWGFIIEDALPLLIRSPTLRVH